jgi:hypothetical protein
MTSPTDIQITKVDLTLFATVLTVSNLVYYQLFPGRSLFDNEWMNSSVATLLAVALHGLVTNKLSATINTQLDTKNAGIENSVADLVKFGTIFAAGKVFLHLMKNEQIVFNQAWFTQHGTIIAGYALFNMLLKQYVPVVSDKQQPLLNDLIKVSTGALLSVYVMQKALPTKDVYELGGVLAGFVVFHLLTKQLVVPVEKFSDMGGISINCKITPTK